MKCCFYYYKLNLKLKLNQFDSFVKALEIYTSPNFRKDLSLLEELIQLKWRMNAHTNEKKKGSLEGDLQNIRTFFQKTN